MSRPAPSPIYTLRGAGGPLNTLHFSCHGGDTPLLFSGSGKGAIHIWNLNTRRPERILEGHSGSSVIWVSTVQARDTLISQGRDMQICLWDLSQGRSEVVDSVWTGSVGFCQCSMLETSPENYLLAFAGQQTEEIKIIELLSKTPVCTLVPDAKLGMVMCLKLWQQEATADTITPLSTLSLSITHTHKEEATDNDLHSVFPLAIPPSLLPTVETRSDYPPLFPRQTQQQIYCRAFKPSLPEFMEKIKRSVKLHFLLNSASLQQNPTQP